MSLFLKIWRVELDSARRKETAVHESRPCSRFIGHILQKSNDSISVMRQYEFNYKDYPQSDDWAGINARY